MSSPLLRQKIWRSIVRQEIRIGSGLLSRERERSDDLVRQRVPSLGVCWCGHRSVAAAAIVTTTDLALGVWRIWCKASDMVSAVSDDMTLSRY
ncbi:hypothetical protein DM860_016610 [Cuscuta australis]|uniref:Uncharacterized protein n=1 Tax=Cuscuta australis TaxID=267555 RepID=A0A328DKJ5_9ASTE|nr:hypothetical protein DM860_016610 [Cuscuta australis]